MHELDVWLLAGEMIRPDAGAALPLAPGRRRLAESARGEGRPARRGFRWMEVEGPIFDEWPTAGHKLLFGDLPS